MKGATGVKRSASVNPKVRQGVTGVTLRVVSAETLEALGFSKQKIEQISRPLNLVVGKIIQEQASASLLSD